jgi:predicted nicotinamide N-methyase
VTAVEGRQGRIPLRIAPVVVAGYPTRRVPLQFGTITVELLAVDCLDDVVDATALLRDAVVPEPPYWAHLWPASRALARLFATEVECAGRRSVEIGCGLGLAGIVAARRGAAVTVIDTAREALCFARANAELNGCRLSVLQTDLRRPGLRGRFDYCLAADVTYDPTLQRDLAVFVATQLESDGRAWCAESVRTSDSGFRQACERHGLQVIEREARERDDGRDVLVRINEVRRP